MASGGGIMTAIRTAYGVIGTIFAAGRGKILAMSTLWSRRAILSALAAATTVAEGADRVPPVPTEARRLRDPATEFDVFRLTDPAKASAFLPQPPLRSLARNNSMVYCSDRGGSLQAWRMDLKSGESRILTDAKALNPDATGLTPDDKSLLYFDGGSSLVLHNGTRTKTICQLESGWTFTADFTLSDDGTLVAWVEQKGGRFRVRVASATRGGPSTLFEANQPAQYIRLRPKRPGVLYNHQGVLTLVEPGGRNSRRLNVAGGGLAGFALWSADGKALHYLSVPEGRGQVQLREHFPDTGEDKLIGSTTQFVSFARNGDSSMFAGISGSKAAPYILLFARSARRELVLAEHKASTPGKALVAFSPNSQKLYYATDREGKPAIYTMGLERFVDETTGEDKPSATEASRKKSRQRSGPALEPDR